uniref:Peptidase A2 domain-containing protein n=1 Tax=Nothobranchius furzeri TaxID=105023 RepID=A0A1A8AYV0_NOTFU
MIQGRPLEFLCDTGACRTVVSSGIKLPESRNTILVKSADGALTRSPLSKPVSVVDPVTGWRKRASVVVAPSCPLNLLGRDLMSAFKISVVPVGNGMRAIRTDESEECFLQSDHPDSQGVYYSLRPVIDDLAQSKLLMNTALSVLPNPSKIEMPIIKLHVTMALRPDVDHTYQDSFFSYSPVVLSTTHLITDGDACSVASVLLPTVVTPFHDVSTPPHISLTRNSSTRLECLGHMVEKATRASDFVSTHFHDSDDWQYSPSTGLYRLPLLVLLHCMPAVDPLQ